MDGRIVFALRTVVVVAAIFALTSCEPRRDPAMDVQLLLTTKAFEANSAFELRFPVDMAAADEIGTKVTLSPLRVNPSLPGEFRWLSARKGVYTPTEAPRLGTKYRFRLSSGLQNAMRQTVALRLDRTLETPPFQITNLRTGHRSSTNVPVRPELTLEFNAPVDVAEIKSHLVFTSDGKEMHALVNRVHGSQLRGFLTHPELSRVASHVTPGWSESFRRPEPPVRTTGASNDDLLPPPPPAPRSDDDDDAQTNVVRITPLQPLTPGSDWALEVRAGLPSTLPAVALKKTVTLPIGKVETMRVIKVEAGNDYQYGKRIQVRFNRRPDDLTKVNVSPQPDHLSLTGGYRDVTIGGDFELNRSYLVTVSPELKSVSGEQMNGAYQKVVRFEPLPPLIRIPSFNVVQWAGGKGRLHLEAVNTPRIDFRAKPLSPETYLQVRRGYDRHARGGSREVPFDLVPGPERDGFGIESTAEPDQTDRLMVDLRDLFGQQPGAIFVEASGRGVSRSHRERATTQAIIQHTDLGLLWKNHAEGSWVHAFSLADGAPLSEVEVSLLNRKNRVIARSTTDTNGVVQLDADGADAYLFARLDQDVNGLARSSAELWRYGFGLPLRWQSEAEARALFFIDKPVCRPGETVRFKAIARTLGDKIGIPEAESKRRATLSIHDPRGRSVLSTNLHLSDRGSLAFAFTTAKAKYGVYRATFSWANAYQSVTFVAQDYEADAFEVKVDGPKRLLADEPVELPVTARYFLGKDITPTKLKWSLQAADERFQPKGFDDFRFGDWIEDSRIVSGQDSFSVHGGVVPTNDFVIRAEVPIDIVTPAPRRVQAIAEVTDLNQQTVSGQSSFLIDSSEYYLGIAEPKRPLRVGDAFQPQLVAVDRFGQALKSEINATLRLRRADWHSVAIQGAGNQVRYRNELRLIDLFQTIAPVSEAVTLPACERPGRHLLEAEGMDAKGNRIYTAIAFHVIGHDQADWEQRNDQRIDLVPDREEYRVGEHAEILIKSPLKGRAIVSIERNNIHRTFATNLTGNATVVRVPLTSKDAPNNFVSVTVLRGAEDSPRDHQEPDFRYGYCQLKVVDDATRLTVSARPNKREYQPGDKVTTNVDVLDSDGQGVPGAEVTLYAVDEGVLSLRGYETPDPLALFNAARGLAVTTHLSLKHLQPADPANIRFHNKGFLVGGGGDPLRRGARTNFIACPLWKPGLVTDEHGKVSASFIAPDSLTRYRIIAVAHVDVDRFGHAEDKFEINQPLIVEPVLPRFARRGDRLNVRALLINQTEHDDTVEVTWERVGKAITAGEDNRTQRVAIRAGQTKTARFPMNFTNTGVARWKWSARFLSTNASSYTDSVISQLRVEEPLPLMRASLIGVVSGKSNLLATVDPQLLDGVGTVTVRVSNSPFIQLNGGMNYLLRYPYGCVEQTSSSLLPWIVLRRDPVLQRLYQKTPEQIDQAITAGVERLATMQVSAGGFAYWPGGSKPTAWGSAYAGLVLQLARRAGAQPNGLREQDLARYLRDRLHRVNPRHVPSFDESHATALYTLALLGRREAEIFERLHAQRQRLSAETCALAALAMLTGKYSAEERAMATELLGESPSSTQTVFRGFGSRTRLRAIELMACRRLGSDRQHDLTQKLLADRKNGCWLSTQANAWSLLALAEMEKPDGRKLQAKLAWGPEDATFDFAADPVQHEQTFELSAARQGLPLQLQLPEDATLYVEVDVSSHVEREFKPVTDKGFTIKRYFHRLAADGSAERAENLEIGDTIVVTLDLTAPEPSDYVAIDDPLPAVLQAINPEFKSQVSGQDGWSTANWHNDYHELRHDRALFFRNQLPPGNYRIQYLARVRADGQCAAPPARIEEMYNPNRHGFSAPQRLEARP